MKKATLHRLLRKYLNNTINTTDCNELLNYLSSANPEEVADLVEEELLNLDEGPAFGEEQSNEVLKRIKSDPRFQKTVVDSVLPSPKSIKFHQRSWLRIAASILVFLTAGLLAVYHNIATKTVHHNTLQQKSAVIVPGSKKATLKMANGQVLLLENASNGILAKAGNSSIVKTRNGQIKYDTNPGTADKQISYNTLTTPKGGEYQVVLPDGTKVWLNAASSISYPVVFAGNERLVKLTGEAYFEVAKDKQRPFYITINKVQVRVLGTHFNIAAYSDDEEITTTLLEGSVRITKNKTQSLLIPGQQAVINPASDHIVVSEANINDVMAWKNGHFTFSDENIRSIMKKVSRWYDVDIGYEGSITNQNFGGTFYRSKSITELLHHLEKIGKVHFKIEGRRVIVME